MKDLITPVDLDVIDPPPKRSPTSRILSLPTPSLPLDDCAIFSPSLIWNNELSLFHLDDIDLSDRLHLNEIQDLLDVLFGLPRRNIDMPKVRFRYTPGVNAFATTLVFRDFQPEYVNYFGSDDHILYYSVNHSDFFLQIHPQTTRKTNGGFSRVPICREGQQWNQPTLLRRSAWQRLSRAKSFRGALSWT